MEQAGRQTEISSSSVDLGDCVMENDRSLNGAEIYVISWSSNIIITFIVKVNCICCITRSLLD